MYGQLELILNTILKLVKSGTMSNLTFRMQLFVRVNEQMISLNLFHFWFYDFCRLNHVVYL